MPKYSGACRGGPYDNQGLVADRKQYRVAIAQPTMWGDIERGVPDVFPPIRFGHYHYVLGQWIWREDGYADR